MATQWFKSLHCNSKTATTAAAATVDDVIIPSPFNQPLLPPSSCRHSFRTTNDVIHARQPAPVTAKSLRCNPKTKTATAAVADVIDPSSSRQPHLPSSTCRCSSRPLHDVIHTHRRPNPKPAPFTLKPLRCNPKTTTTTTVDDVIRAHHPKPEPAPVVVKSLPLPHPFFQSVLELKVGHPSRNVVEIIFISKWGPKGFPGRVEMVFKIHNKARVSTRFEEYLELIKSKAKSGSGSGQDPRCSADGNEMMRFRCVGPTTVEKKGVAICTYGSGGVAHDSGGGGGRRGMLVCRVIAGRVGKRVGFGVDGNGAESEFDSVSGENGELVVFDHRAVLPCFLVIYKL